jgi:hypothetical protein
MYGTVTELYTTVVVDACNEETMNEAKPTATFLPRADLERMRPKCGGRLARTTKRSGLFQ